MEIVNPCVDVMSNYEVLEFVRKEIQRKDIKKKPSLRNYSTISYETLRYLDELPCSKQTRTDVCAFVTAMRPFKLTKTELLTITNDPPKTILDMQLMIEDLDGRVSEEHHGIMLEIINTYLGEKPTEKPIKKKKKKKA